MTLNILVVDDDKSNQVLMADMLDVLGHTATVAASGAAALDLVKAHSFDLILMDCGMPDMDGFATTRALRAMEEAETNQENVVIALTGNVEPGIERECRNAGMNDYLAKPFILDQLVEKLKKWSGSA